MVHVTPANEHYTRCNQDCDERQAILTDLSRNLRDYLAHQDAMVRCYADWAREYWGIRPIRGTKPDRHWATHYLHKLHIRLREVAD